MKGWTAWGLFAICWFAGWSTALGQEPAADPNDQDETIRGGVIYSPERDPNNKLRDPFKSPFELEEEEKALRERDKAFTDRGEVEEFDVGELDLSGIYLDALTGYWAIFKIGDDYNWFQVGIKFRDGDLVNITDNAVVFKYYTSDDPTQVREVVKELHRGEE